MERLPAVSLCRFGFEVVPDADGVRQRPADRDAEPDARDPQRRSREQIGQRHAGAQRRDGEHHRHLRLVHGAVITVEQKQDANADVARALDAQVVDARRPVDAPPQHDDAQTRRRHLQRAGLLRRRNAGPHSTGLEVKILAVFR